MICIISILIISISSIACGALGICPGERICPRGLDDVRGYPFGSIYPQRRHPISGTDRLTILQHWCPIGVDPSNTTDPERRKARLEERPLTIHLPQSKDSPRLTRDWMSSLKFVEQGPADLAVFGSPAELAGRLIFA